MAACSIFDEDEVCVSASSGGFRYGLVVESSEYASSDEEDDDQRVKRGFVKVAWHPSGDENIIAEKKVMLADRSLMPGDVVRRLISDKDSQRGFIEDIDVKCHVKVLGTDTWIYNVNSKQIMPIQEWDPEPEVVLDSWVGQIQEVREDVTIKFPCGARCKFEDADLGTFEDLNDKRKESSLFLTTNYYPGQELSACYAADFYNAKWVETSSLRNPKTLGSKNLFLVPVVVEKVETKDVDIKWLCRGFTQVGGNKDSVEIPATVVKKNDLKRMKTLDCFEHCSIQLGDKGFYVVQENDAVMKGLSPRKHTSPDVVATVCKGEVTVLNCDVHGKLVLKKEQKGGSDGKTTQEVTQETKSVEGACGIDDSCSDTANRSSSDGAFSGDGIGKLEENDEDEDADVENIEDSDEESDTGSTHSGQPTAIVRRKNRKRPCLHTRSMKKLKGKKAKTKQRLPERSVCPGDKVPVEVCYTFSIASVMWQDGSIERDIPSPELFPIHHLDEFEFFPGDYVVDAKGTGNLATEYGVVVSSDHRERTCIVKWIRPYQSGKTQRPELSEEEEVSVYDIKNHPDYKFRPGSVVIRVGGFEDSGKELEAVGQVHRLDPGGEIHVWWPNKTITSCYPQDLYIISDEMSDVNSSEWSDEEEEEEEEGSDVSWETEDEESVEEEEEAAEIENKPENKEETKVEKTRSEWAESKMKDLDELLQRVLAALSSLLDLFVSVPGPFFKSSKQVFQDILVIFRRCKEMEKNLKSSFFDEPEITELMSEIREQLRKERTTKLAWHVAQLYEYRNNVNTDSAKLANLEKMAEDRESQVDISSTSQTVTKQQDENTESTNQLSAPGGVANQSAGADGVSHCDIGAQVSESLGSLDDSPQTKLYREVLKRHFNSIEDPLSQIVFETCLDAAVARSAKDEIEKRKEILSETCKGNSDGEKIADKTCTKQSPSEVLEIDVSTRCGNKRSGCMETSVGSERAVNENRSGDTKKVLEQSVQEIIDSVINSACQLQTTVGASSTVMTLREQARKKVEQMCMEGMARSRTEPGILSLVIGKPDVCDVSVNTTQWRVETGTQTSESCTTSNKSNQTENVGTSMPSSHRNLCIRVCKALNKRVGYIQEEVKRRWQIYQNACQQGEQDQIREEGRESAATDVLEEMKNGENESTCDTSKKSEENSEMLSPVKDNSESLQPSCSEVRPETSPEGDNSLSDLTGSDASRTDLSRDVQEETNRSGFQICEEVPLAHRFKFHEHKAVNPKSFNSAVRKELMLLRNSLPEGILVKTFEDRMDLFSVLIVGPEKTPYEGGLFAFDVQLPDDYSQSPPNFHYLSYCNERLNPNLYEDGKVCVSLLGTWSGKGNEVWTSKSNLLQVLVSIQGLILVSEPYYNEAGYERQRNTQEGEENSRMYNEMAILKLVQSMTKMAVTPPAMFVEETHEHLQKHAHRMIERLEYWIDTSRHETDKAAAPDDTVKAIRSDSTQLQGESATQSCDVASANNGNASESCDCTSESRAGNLDSESAVRSSRLNQQPDIAPPDFPLLPASKGFCITLKKHLDVFKNILKDSIHKKPQLEALI